MPAASTRQTPLKLAGTAQTLRSGSASRADLAHGNRSDPRCIGGHLRTEYKVQASMTVNGNDVNIDRTTRVEIKEVGTTKLDVSEEAKKKLS